MPEYTCHVCHGPVGRVELVCSYCWERELQELKKESYFSSALMEGDNEDFTECSSRKSGPAIKKRGEENDGVKKSYEI